MKPKKQLGLCMGLLAFMQLKAQTPELYIKMYKDLAISEMKRHKVPASISLAQGILESGSGVSELARKSNNHFGIKCHSSWTGDRTYHDDDAQGECFRVYDHPSESYRDHSLFLKNNQRYSELFTYDITDYEAWAHGLKKKGYATLPTYADKLISLIERYQLHQYDKMDGMQEIASKQSNGKYQYIVHPNGIKFVTAEKGQTLTSLSRSTGVSTDRLVAYNDFTYEQILQQGQRIFLQEKRKYGHENLHIVKSGETMHQISQMYGIQLRYLYERNKLPAGSQPSEGDKIVMRTYKK